jgi:hypothetical protein
MEYVKSEHQINDVETDRNLYIGGSDLPSILRLNSKYGTSLIQFAKEKLKIIPTEFQGNEYTRYGQFMEPQVRNYINSMYDYKFKEDSIIDKTRMYRGNCDGIDKKKKILLEIKTFGSKLDIKLYEPQCQFYMELFDIEECLLVGYKRPAEFYTGIDYSLDNGAEFFDLDFKEESIVVYKIKRDRDMFAKIEIEINKFKYLLAALREEEILNGTTRRIEPDII